MSKTQIAIDHIDVGVCYQCLAHSLLGNAGPLSDTSSLGTLQKCVSTDQSLQ